MLDKAYATKDDLANIDGKSAYEQAVDGGYTGTEAEFKQALADINNYAKSEDVPTTAELKKIKADNILHSTGNKFCIGENKVASFEDSYYDEDTKTLYYASNHPSLNSWGLIAIDYSDIENPTIKGFNDLNNSSLELKSGSPVVRGIAKYDKYLYIGIRSTSPNIPSDGMDNESTWGALVIVDTTDYSVVDTIKLNAKVTGVIIHEATNGKVYLVLSCQMSYIRFYTIDKTNPTSLTLEDTQYHSNYSKVSGWTDYNSIITETQRGRIVEADNKILCVMAGFGDGVHIWDITNVSATNEVRATLYNWNSWSHKDIWFIDGTSAYHTFDLEVVYPYVYATLGAKLETAQADYTNGTNNRRMGLLTLDISNLANIQATIQQIDVADMNDFLGGDPRPTFIKRFANKLFLNNGTKGIAIYDISNLALPQYVATKEIPDFMSCGGLCVTEGGKLICGDAPEVQTSTSEGYKAKKYIKLFNIM